MSRRNSDPSSPDPALSPSHPRELEGPGGAAGWLHPPVRGDGPPVFLPPGVGARGAVLRAEEPHQLPQGRLHHGGFRAHQSDPGKVGQRVI